ncbi:uncharacterized protein [Coffea arabica]|uniref:Uncharacterized protein n=1 Tax=Coffea arabica TaxID=13443 RepID=A0A6P6U4W8_COFAR|nr:uncharacterized protein LOC113707653 [Coffea arabica]
MKKLYRRGSVHPSPPLKPDHLSFLPPTILTLTVALSPQDREVLAYLISCSSSSNFSGNNRRRNTSSATANSSNNYSNNSCGADHPPSFDCYCFGCYMSYWARWDSSPNRQLIHEIIDAYEDGLSTQSKKEKSRKDRRKGGKGSAELKRSEPTPPSGKELTESSDNSREDEIVDTKGSGEADDGGEEREGVETERSSVRRFVSFLGEKIWGGWT